MLKTELRKAREAVAAGDLAAAQAQARLVAKKFDQAAAKGLIHANAAARTKSRLAVRLKTLQGKASHGR
jgi:small subunit ribosomal protein S20